MDKLDQQTITTSHRLSGSPAKFAVGGQIALMFALTTLPTPLYHDYARAFGFPVTTLTLIYATYVAGTLFALFLLGRLSDQIGRRRVSVAAWGLAAAAVLLFLFATSTAMLFLARLATGLAAGLSSGTATAWLRDLHRKDQEKTASVRTVAINLMGLGIGPLLCGVLSAYTPYPFRSPYAVYFVLLVIGALVTAATRDTVKDRRPLEEAEIKPRVGVPREIRAAFVAPGVTTFVIFSLVGFYSAIAPGLMADVLHVTNHAAAGAIVFELFLAGAITAIAASGLAARTAMLWGAAAMLPALALLVFAQLNASLPAFLAGTAVGGISLGFGYRGSLEVANAVAPGDKRAELISALFVCGNLGLAVPVLGVGFLSPVAGPPAANLAFAGVIALLSVAGLVFGIGNRAEQ